MPTDRKIRWAANFFIWSSVVLLVVIVVPTLLDELLRRYPTGPTSAKDFGAIVGFTAGRALRLGWLFILVIVNGLVLRRYKSRVAAGLSILLGLTGVGSALFMLQLGFDWVAVEVIVFFGTYLLVAVWAFVALSRSPAVHQ